MRIDFRVKHDVETRRLAAELFADGLGRAAAAKRLSVPEAAVRKWQQIYRAFGSEVLLTMDGRQARYTYEQKAAAARAVVEDGMAKPAAMAEFGIMSMTPLDRWCRLYREGGAEALRPRPKGRPKGSKAEPRELTREQELEERCRRLEAEVAYLKKLRALVERDGLWPGRGPRRWPRCGRTGTTWGTCSRARGSRGPRTTTRWRTRPGRPGPSCAGRSRRSSRAPPTAAATGRWPCACAPSWACASPTRPCSR